ncbi:hypothetical protein ACO22_07665 [Paracoccidioides brasiliensis]|uniref:Uncharacterized protein n=1 Tax=Paracoccidioides brasiliensis TaxID=121759 RepID=A0A1D2J444_PARBR|nr:hypothetical protein ACO22_07665 [Paracoccidioides brasiliensis]
MVQSETCAWAGPWLVLNLPSPTDPFRALTLGFVRGFTRGGEGKIARGQKQDPRVSASGGWWLGLNTLNSSPPFIKRISQVFPPCRVAGEGEAV